MKDWRTTLAGLVTGLPFAIDSLLQAYTAGYFTDKTGWTLFGSLAWILVTALVKDSKKNDEVQNIISPKPPRP